MKEEDKIMKNRIQNSSLDFLNYKKALKMVHTEANLVIIPQAFRRLVKVTLVLLKDWIFKL